MKVNSKKEISRELHAIEAINLWLLIVEKVGDAAVGGSERWRSAKSVRGAYLMP